MTRIRRVFCSFLIHSLTFFFGVAVTGPEFAPFALVAIITAYALAQISAFRCPYITVSIPACIIYHGMYAGIHHLLSPTLIVSTVRLYQCALYMDGLDAMPLCDTNAAGME